MSNYLRGIGTTSASFTAEVPSVALHQDHIGAIALKDRPERDSNRLGRLERMKAEVIHVANNSTGA